MNTQTTPQRPTNAGAVVNARKDLIAFFDSQAVVARVEQAIPSGTDFKWLLATFKLALNQNPKLQHCTRDSLYAALMKCAQAGLVPDGRNAFLIPYGEQCQVIFSYIGMADLVYRSGEVSSIECDVVYDADEFEWSRGLGGRLYHRPNLKAKERGEAYCFYSWVVMRDGRTSACVMRRDEIDAIRSRSKSGNNGPWVTDYTEMGKKTVFRRHQKLLPMSPAIRRRLESDDEPLSTDEARFAEANRIAPPVKSFLGAPEDNGPTEAPVEVEQPKAKPTPTRKIEPTRHSVEQAADDSASPLPVTATDDAYYAELARILKSQSATLSEFLTMAESGGIIPDATSYGSMEEIPIETVKTLLKDKTALINAIAASKH